MGLPAAPREIAPCARELSTVERVESIFFEDDRCWTDLEIDRDDGLVNLVWMIVDRKWEESWTMVVASVSENEVFLDFRCQILAMLSLKLALFNARTTIHLKWLISEFVGFAIIKNMRVFGLTVIPDRYSLHTI